METCVDSRARTRGRENRPVLDEQSVLGDVDFGIRRPELVGVLPVRRGRLPVEHPTGRERENARADGDHPGAALTCEPHRLQVTIRDGETRVLIARDHDDIGVLHI